LSCTKSKSKSIFLNAYLLQLSKKCPLSSSKTFGWITNKPSIGVLIISIFYFLIFQKPNIEKSAAINQIKVNNNCSFANKILIMKKVNLLIVSIALILSSCNNANYKTPETEMEKVSYSLGVNVATGVKAQGIESLDINAISKAINDVFEGNDLDISEEESMQVLQEYFGKIAAEKQAKSSEVGIAFLAENATKEGVTTTESGLQYEILSSGDGAKPNATDQVTVHYHGMLTDGTVFDSSVDRGEPATFPVNGVIPGWVEALQLMSVGDKWKLTIPSELAYGDRGAGGLIGPGATLVFEVELLGINN
jgi:FKBP-type peptidyl-prolyl cis-trans isomerase FklB